MYLKSLFSEGHLLPRGVPSTLADRLELTSWRPRGCKSAAALILWRGLCVYKEPSRPGCVRGRLIKMMGRKDMSSFWGVVYQCSRHPPANQLLPSNAVWSFRLPG